MIGCILGFCGNCKEKKDMQNITKNTLKNGQTANYGNCPTCKNKMFKVTGKKNEGLIVG